MYESIFQHQRSKEDSKSLPLTVNGTFRPLNPHPFSLATLEKSGKPVKKSRSQAYAGTSTKDTPCCSHVYADNTLIMSSVKKRKLQHYCLLSRIQILNLGNVNCFSSRM